LSSTGVSGFTLGSGSGWLERKLDFAADSLISGEVVLADGAIGTVSEGEHPDLFWGLRGGSGKFGIVTMGSLSTRAARRPAGAVRARPCARSRIDARRHRTPLRRRPRSRERFVPGAGGQPAIAVEVVGSPAAASAPYHERLRDRPLVFTPRRRAVSARRI
jgi:hypothetical protein